MILVWVFKFIFCLIVIAIVLPIFQVAKKNSNLLMDENCDMVKLFQSGECFLECFPCYRHDVQLFFRRMFLYVGKVSPNMYFCGAHDVIT